MTKGERKEVSREVFGKLLDTCFGDRVNYIGKSVHCVDPPSNIGSSRTAWLGTLVETNSGEVYVISDGKELKLFEGYKLVLRSMSNGRPIPIGKMELYIDD